jgi:hypothetical protein
MDHLSLGSYPEGQIKPGVEFSSAAFASGLATDSGHGDQRAHEQGLFVKELGQTGSGLAFLGRQVATVAHDSLLSF